MQAQELNTKRHKHIDDSENLGSLPSFSGECEKRI